MRCDFEKLWRYLNEKLEQDAQLEVREHLDNCDICFEFVATVNRENHIKGSSQNGKPDANGIDRARPTQKPTRLWSIILAGGNGERISADIHRWKGRPIPKQYCAFVGTRSMLQHTLARADALGSRDRQLTVIARSHLPEAQLQLADRSQGTVIVQPANRNTLAGVFLPLTYVYARDPEATLVIQPSDHFIYPEKTFLEVAAQAVQATEELPHMLILLGATAEGIEPDYGWIRPGQEIWRNGKYRAIAVNQFLEKPSPVGAASITAAGGLWNTMIVAAKARTLWELGGAFFPGMLRLFEKLYGAIGMPHEDSVLSTIYEFMPEQNFSRDLLTPAASHLAVMPMEDIIWSDWGRVERIAETLFRVGKRPSFPMISAGSNRLTANGLSHNDFSTPSMETGRRAV
jgi:mannose-1-phosphate guanylyltransferase